MEIHSTYPYPLIIVSTVKARACDQRLNRESVPGVGLGRQHSMGMEGILILGFEVTGSSPAKVNFY